MFGTKGTRSGKYIIASCRDNLRRPGYVSIFHTTYIANWIHGSVSQRTQREQSISTIIMAKMVKSYMKKSNSWLPDTCWSREWLFLRSDIIVREGRISNGSALSIPEVDKMFIARMNRTQGKVENPVMYGNIRVEHYLLNDPSTTKPWQAYEASNLGNTIMPSTEMWSLRYLWLPRLHIILLFVWRIDCLRYEELWYERRVVHRISHIFVVTPSHTKTLWALR